jgi:hypothetical protein
MGSLGSAPRPDAFPQKEVFENKLSFSRYQRAAARAARYLAIICLRTSFDFDDLVERRAVRACERIERRRSATSPDTPPTRKLIVET